MKLIDIINEFGFKILSGDVDDKIAEGVYVCDLLSHCMSKVSENDIWITVQNNINVAAVCHLADAAAILLPEGISPDADLLNKAIKEDIIILQSEKTAYELCNLIKLY